MQTVKLYFALVLFLSLTTTIATAQVLSKEEKKALKKELKELSKNPERLQQMKDESKELDLEMKDKESLVTDKSFWVDDLDRQLKAKDQEIDLLIKERSDLSIQLTSSGNKDTTSFTNTVNKVNTKEVYFSVQIGAYKNLKFVEKLKNHTNFTIEEDNSSGYKKFLIGKFNTYKEAKNLTKMLSKSGAQCFVVGYQNNTRVTNLKQLPAKYLKY